MRACFTEVVERLRDIREVVTRYGRDGLTATALPGVSVMRATRTTGPCGDVLEPAMVLVVGGLKQTALHGNVFRYGAGDHLVVSVDLPVVGRIVAADEREPFMAVVMRLRPERIAALLFDTGAAVLPSDEVWTSAIGVGPAPPLLLDAVARLLELLDRPADVAALAPGLEREILWRLLTGPQGAAIRQIGTPDSRLAHVARAIRWIREHYDRPLRVADIAAIAAMSPSSFHRHFRALTSMTPVQFQKQLRLNEAHVRLLSGGTEVAAVASAVGYASPSQFSREYRRMFGVAPSHTTRMPEPAA